MSTPIQVSLLLTHGSPEDATYGAALDYHFILPRFPYSFVKDPSESDVFKGSDLQARATLTIDLADNAGGKGLTIPLVERVLGGGRLVWNEQGWKSQESEAETRRFCVIENTNDCSPFSYTPPLSAIAIDLEVRFAPRGGNEEDGSQQNGNQEVSKLILIGTSPLSLLSFSQGFLKALESAYAQSFAKQARPRFPEYKTSYSMGKALSASVSRSLDKLYQLRREDKELRELCAELGTVSSANAAGFSEDVQSLQFNKASAGLHETQFGLLRSLEKQGEWALRVQEEQRLQREFLSLVELAYAFNRRLREDLMPLVARGREDTQTGKTGKTAGEEFCAGLRW